MQRPRSPFFMDIWNFIDDNARAAPVRGSSRHAVPMFYPVRFLIGENDHFEDYGGFTDTRVRDLIASRSLDHYESYEAPIDVKAVLAKCRTELYKPKPTNGWKGKAERDENECPVCLEKFIAEDQLLLLPCNHRFHSNCLIPWVKSNHARCPCCRADILGGVKKDEKVTPLPISNTSYGSSNTGRSTSNSTIRNVPISSRAPPASNSNSFRPAEELGGGRREDDDVMAILVEMEAALNRWGFLG